MAELIPVECLGCLSLLTILHSNENDTGYIWDHLLAERAHLALSDKVVRSNPKSSQQLGTL